MRTKVTQIGTVGVDAGMLYLGDPCYVIDAELGKKPWDEFLRELYASRPEGNGASYWIATGKTGWRSFPAGVVVTTGYGDGEYPVFAEINEEGRVMSVTVNFK